MKNNNKVLKSALRLALLSVVMAGPGFLDAVSAGDFYSDDVLQVAALDRRPGYRPHPPGRPDGRHGRDRYDECGRYDRRGRYECHDRRDRHDRYRPPRTTVVQIDTLKADKIIDSSRRYRIHMDGVTALILEGENSIVDVQEVIVVYGNGWGERLYRLEGRIYDRDVKIAGLDMRFVREIQIRATSPALFGGKGKVKILLERIVR